MTVTMKNPSEEMERNARVERRRQLHKEIARYRVVKIHRRERNGERLPSRTTVLRSGITFDEAAELQRNLQWKFARRIGWRIGAGGPEWKWELENKDEVIRRMNEA